MTLQVVRAAMSALAPGGERGRLSILIFHRVPAVVDPLFPEVPEAGFFERQLYWLRDWFNALPLREGVERLRSRSLPPRALAITFDDGYGDNESVALPILKRLGLPATFFVSTGFLDGGRMWNDKVIESIRACEKPQIDLTHCQLGIHDLQTIPRRRAAIDTILKTIKHLPSAQRSDRVAAISEAAGTDPVDALMMTSEQVRRLHRAGMEIGAHTVNHPILAVLNRDEARREIAESKEHLEGLLGDRVRLFAYPNGVPMSDYVADQVQLVRQCGFSAAVSTAWGVASAGSDFFQLPRFTPWDRSAWRYGLRMAQNLRRTECATA